MFGNFFNKPKVESGPKPLIPEFVENPEVQTIVSECAEAWRNAFAYTHDGQLDKAKEYNEQLNRLLEEHKEEIRSYLQPYIDLGREKLKEYARGPENDRRQVASMLI